MRGKTNIPNRKDPVINGDVENFVVAENNTIEKGDFVSVVRSSDYRLLSDSKNCTLVYKKLYDVANKKMVIVHKNEQGVLYATLVQGTSNGVEVLHQVVLDAEISTSITMKFDFNIQTNSLFYIHYVGSSHAKYNNVYKYTIINDELVEQNVITISFPTDGVYGISVFGVDEHIGIVHGTSGYFRVYSKNSNNEYVQTLSDTIAVTGLSSNGIYFVGSGNNLVIVIGSSNQSGNSGYHIVKFYNFSSTDGTISKEEINVSGINFYNTGYDIQIVGNTFYLVNSVKYNASSGSVYWCKPKILILDISLMLTKYYEEITTITPSWCNWFIDYGNESEVIIHSISRYGTATYGQAMSSVIVLSENELGEFNLTIGNFQNINMNQAGMFGFMFDDVIKNVSFTYDYASSSGAVLSIGVVEHSFIVAENQILFGEPTNYVREYDNKSAIGFAKTSGNAGDTIQVYVPHNNS